MSNRPLDLLSSVLNSPIIVKLKDGREFRGNLQGYDMHLNLVLDDTEEIKDGKNVKKYGTMIIRGDNVIYVSP
ncbi:MAG: Putative snRNP Sm-like protein [Candidatus Methanolliviera sp. GoM_oil]|jgi:Small nuclear ribonucleoprotein, LSM family|nr:MAG: Putative snRNP Sm-like protein [Candidatus Methanolliviera sp. GoM_oil]VUT26452.1 MAG: Putative snRNP Sm-like protein [Candidatus Methanolliviera sp. GoM_asphalt]